MPQISAMIGKSTYDAIKRMAQQEQISTSKIGAMLIEKGLTACLEHEKFLLLKKNQMEQRRSLHRLLNICSELFLTLNKEKNHYNADPQSILLNFKRKAHETIGET